MQQHQGGLKYTGRTAHLSSSYTQIKHRCMLRAKHLKEDRLRLYISGVLTLGRAEEVLMQARWFLCGLTNENIQNAHAYGRKITCPTNLDSLQHTNTSICTHLHVHTHIHTHTHARACTHAHMHACTHTHACTLTQTHTHTHTHTHFKGHQYLEMTLVRWIISPMFFYDRSGCTGTLCLHA